MGDLGCQMGNFDHSPRATQLAAASADLACMQRSIQRRTRADHAPAFRYVEDAPLAWHVTIRVEHDGWLARAPSEMRVAASIVVAQLAGHVLAFRFVDTHAHLLLSGERAAVGKRVQILEATPRRVLKTRPFEPARIRGVFTGEHLWATLGYVLRQTSRHKAKIDLAHDGSILPDLLGLRMTTPNPVPHVLTFFPRIDATVLRRMVGWPELAGFEPDPRHLAEAAAGAFGLRDLTAETKATRDARRAAVQAVALKRGQLAALLDLDPATVSRLRHRPVAREQVHLVQQQLRLRTAIAAEIIQVPERA